jgi:hypothetical protein
LPIDFYNFLKKFFLGTEENGEDNEVLRMFRNPPYDVKMRLWTISVQNADDIVKHGAKPAIVEKGPYTFE